MYFSNIFRAVLAVGVIGIAATAQAGETLNRVMKTKTMKIAASATWPPQAFLNDKNELDGFDIDVSKELARRLGVAINFDAPSFDVVTGGHWKGRWDAAVFSVTPTKPRAQRIDFPAIYYYSPYVFVVHNKSKIQSRSDLEGKIIGVEGGTTSEDFIRKRLEIDAPGMPAVQYMTQKFKEVKTYADSLLPFDDLRLGAGLRLDAVIAPEQTALNAIKNSYPLRILKNDHAFSEPLVIVTDKGDAEWNAKIAEIINAMKMDGTLAKFSEKWYGKNYAQ